MKEVVFSIVLFSLVGCGYKEDNKTIKDEDGVEVQVNNEKRLRNDLKHDSLVIQNWIDLALSNLKEGKAELSRNQFDSAYKYGLNQDLYEYSIGYTFYWEYEYLRAVLFMEKAIELNPDVAKYHIRLAECYYFIKADKDLVLKTLRKGIILGGEMPANIPSSYINKAELYSTGEKV